MSRPRRPVRVGGVLTDDLLELQRLDTTRRPTRPPPPATSPERRPPRPRPPTRSPRHRRRHAAAVERIEQLEMAHRRARARRRAARHPAHQARGAAEDRDRTARGRGADARAGDARRASRRARRPGAGHTLEEQSALADDITAMDAAAPRDRDGGERRGGRVGRPEADIDGQLAGIGTERAALVASPRRRRDRPLRPAAGPPRRCRRRTARGQQVRWLPPRPVGRRTDRRGACHRRGELADCPHCGRMLVP